MKGAEEVSLPHACSEGWSVEIQIAQGLKLRGLQRTGGLCKGVKWAQKEPSVANRRTWVLAQGHPLLRSGIKVLLDRNASPVLPDNPDFQETENLFFYVVQ